MWDLAPMSIFINYSLCELFISSQYGTGVLHAESKFESNPILTLIGEITI